MSERKTQNELILEHLQAGNSLTVLEALEAPFRCYALSQRCGELRRDGYPIVSSMVKLPSGKRVAQYRIKPEGWCFDCTKPIEAQCVDEEHAYRLAVSPEEYEAMKDGAQLKLIA